MATQGDNCTEQDFNASIDGLLDNTITTNNNNITSATISEFNNNNNNNAVSILVFRAFVIFIGVVGAAFNGLVLKVVTSKKMKSQKKFTALFVNQVVIDFASCFAVVVNYTVKIPVLYLRDGWGFFIVCCLFYTEASVFYFQQGSICNLVLIAVERCLLIVHQTAYKKHFRNWMTYAAIFFAWFISFPYTLQTPFTTRVIDGQCMGQYFWPDKHGQTIYSVFVLFSMFVVPLLLMIVCYTRIFIFVREHQKVMQGTTTGPRSSLQSPALQRQEMGILVTMLLISTAFVACWTPNQVYFLLYIMQIQMSNKDAIYSVSLFLIFLNVCLNPFVYVAKQESIRQGVIEQIGKLKPKQNRPTVSVRDTTATNIEI